MSLQPSTCDISTSPPPSLLLHMVRSFLRLSFQVNQLFLIFCAKPVAGAIELFVHRADGEFTGGLWHHEAVVHRQDRHAAFPQPSL